MKTKERRQKPSGETNRYFINMGSRDKVSKQDLMNFILGIDYTFYKRISFRGGYLLPAEEQGVSFGVGFHQPIKNGIGINVDYSYTDFGIFSGVNRLTVQFSF